MNLKGVFGAREGSEKQPQDGPVDKVELTHDEVLVLFEALSRHFDDGDSRLTFKAPGEEAAFARLRGWLTPLISEVFDENYRELVASAQRRLHERHGSTTDDELLEP